jgi:hypothetical protein
MADETYLGDGLYASLEFGMVKLRAPRESGDHEVFLEPEVLQNFIDYLKTKRILNFRPPPPEPSIPFKR